MEKVTATLAQVTSFLDKCKTEANDILNDPVVKQWTTVHIDKHQSVLKDLDVLPDDLYFAADNYQKAAKGLFKEVSRLENVKSNLEADIRLSGIPPQTAYNEAVKLLGECRQMQDKQEEIRDFHEILTGTAQLIQHNLSIKTLIPLTQTSQSRKKKKLFQDGFDVLAMVSKIPRVKSEKLNIFDLAEQIITIKTKFTTLEFPTMPDLPRAIIAGHVETCKSALEDANNFLTFCERSCKNELQNVETFIDNLENLRKRSFSDILTSLSEEALILRSLIATFENKSRTVKEVRKINFMLTNLQSIYSALRYSYLPHIAAQTTDAGAPLHPDIFAAAISRHYFKGFKGFFRLIRLFFSKTSESGMLTEIELTDKIAIALSTCPYYHAKSKEEISRMTQFVNTLISSYSRPFPAEDIDAIIRNSITAYGSMIEKNFYRFKPEGLEVIDEEQEQEQEGVPQNKAIQIGRLLGKIEIQAHLFKSLQP